MKVNLSELGNDCIDENRHYMKEKGLLGMKMDLKLGKEENFEESPKNREYFSIILPIP